MKTRRSFWVPWVLFAGAGVLALDPFPFESPVVVSAPVPPSVTDPTPVRQPKRVPQYRVASFTYQCSDCHRIIPSPTETLRTLGQHKEIHLRHGINTRCFNCHHRTQRDAFVDDQGEPIPWSEPQLVCAKCHGPVYRDWQAGSHGRINGFWDTSRGVQTRRKCIECHDPHVPPFAPMHPAPGPNTLRMGSPEPPTHTGDHDPLRIYSPERPARSNP
jgi:hypothetical protein